MPEISIDNGIDESDELSVSVSTTASNEELWDRWQYLCQTVDIAGARMNETGQRWKTATDPAAKDRLWAQYETDGREYRVLASWRDVFYAAYVFATDGPGCAVFDDSSPVI